MKTNTIKHVLEQLEIAEKLKRDAARYEGRMESVLESLKEIGCKSIVDAKITLEELQEEEEESGEKLETLSAEFDSKYSDKLENL
mgnify:CR=1 FL=1